MAGLRIAADVLGWLVLLRSQWLYVVRGYPLLGPKS